jgi:hypothetical protein
MGAAASQRGDRAIRQQISLEVADRLNSGARFMVGVVHPSAAMFADAPVTPSVAVAACPASRIDYESSLQRRRRVGPAAKHQCEVCFGSLGVRLDRGCTWSNCFNVWLDACGTCKSAIAQDNR